MLVLQKRCRHLSFFEIYRSDQCMKPIASGRRCSYRRTANNREKWYKNYYGPHPPQENVIRIYTNTGETWIIRNPEARGKAPDLPRLASAL